MRAILLLFLSAAIAQSAATASARSKKEPKGFRSKARQALLVEYPSIRVIYSKNARKQMRPSSLTKLMTTLLVFEAIEAKRIREEEKVSVSKNAARPRGSNVSLRRGGQYPVRDLMLAMIVYSANDATVALAERIAGTEKAFADAMNKRALEIGLLNTSFRNATGFTAKGHLTTALDMARLAGLIIAKYPSRYPLFGRRSVKFGKRTYRNRNPVLGRVNGADGLKTGHTRAGGYGLVASAKRGDRRLILVINGLKSSVARRKEASRMFRWGFTQPAGQE